MNKYHIYYKGIYVDDVMAEDIAEAVNVAFYWLAHIDNNGCVTWEDQYLEVIEA